jgi:hypothetical protein
MDARHVHRWRIEIETRIRLQWDHLRSLFAGIELESGQTHWASKTMSLIALSTSDALSDRPVWS